MGEVESLRVLCVEVAGGTQRVGTVPLADASLFPLTKDDIFRMDAASMNALSAFYNTTLVWQACRSEHLPLADRVRRRRYRLLIGLFTYPIPRITCSVPLWKLPACMGSLSP